MGTSNATRQAAWRERRDARFRSYDYALRLIANGLGNARDIAQRALDGDQQTGES